MRVLVTGNLGYVGTLLVPLLQAAGHSVRGLDVDLFARCSFPRDAAIPRIPTLARDVRDVEAADLADLDAVVHLAGLANDPLGEVDPAVTAAINHHATVRLAECARAAGVRRFLFASSCSIYGAAGDGVVNEESPARPITAYGWSKYHAEQDLLRLAKPAFLPVMLRGATVFGGSPRLRFDLVVNNLVAWASATGNIFLKTDGMVWRPLYHVEDFARAFAAFLEAPASACAPGVFNIGADDGNVLVRDLAAVVAAAVPGSRVVFAEDAGHDSRSYRVSFSRFRTALPEFTPQWTIAAGAEQVAAMLARTPTGPDDFEGAAYQRLAHLTARVAAGELDATFRPATAPVA